MIEDSNVPLDKIVNSILGSAVDNGVREVHIQREMFDDPLQEEIMGLSKSLSFPRREGTVVSFKVAGSLNQQLKLPHYITQPLTARIQELSDAKASQSHGFPEGHLQFEHDSQWYDWQVLVGPDESGDKIVLRQILS